MQKGVVTKAAFGRLMGVTRGRVSQWITEKKLDGPALVNGAIKVAVARRQLSARLGVARRSPTAKARLDGAGVSLIEDDIKAARLRQLELANEKAVAEVAIAGGRYIEVDDARREMGAIAARMIASFEAVLPSFADTVAFGYGMPQRDILRLLQAAWRASRSRLALDAAHDLEAPP